MTLLVSHATCCPIGNVVHSNFIAIWCPFLFFLFLFCILHIGVCPPGTFQLHFCPHICNGRTLIKCYIKMCVCVSTLVHVCVCLCVGVCYSVCISWKRVDYIVCWALWAALLLRVWVSRLVLYLFSPRPATSAASVRRQNSHTHTHSQVTDTIFHIACSLALCLTGNNCSFKCSPFLSLSFCIYVSARDARGSSVYVCMYATVCRLIVLATLSPSLGCSFMVAYSLGIVLVAFFLWWGVSFVIAISGFLYFSFTLLIH